MRPGLFVLAAAALLVLFLGWIDYQTDAYSMLVLYTVPIALGSWFGGVRFGVPLAAVSWLERFYADYDNYLNFSAVSRLNSAGDGIFLLATATMTAVLHAMFRRIGARL